MNKKIEDFFKKKNNTIILIILIIGAVLMLFPKSTEKKEEARAESEYAADDEERLRKILSRIRGAGRVEIMVTYSESAESRPAYETGSDKSDRGEEGCDERIERKPVMADGKPVILSTRYPRVKGVVVIAEGAKDPEVAANISEAVTTAFAIAPHRVCILEKR